MATQNTAKHGMRLVPAPLPPGVRSMDDGYLKRPSTVEANEQLAKQVADLLNDKDADGTRELVSDILFELCVETRIDQTPSGTSSALDTACAQRAGRRARRRLSTSHGSGLARNHGWCH